ncbi:DUF3306 domain-containing protein [Thioalkalivibrio sp. XN279]|uniref:DUF3306 domain-containing protein n=1 Tax=Thioalkalivibrio sp. XN279 TaxID=2714953 RepID=UPI001407946B|nr:DUF3306 domain-containing protein [Thioalkalivibrio sp. XN279]NHA15951.1 DUF3306 domain-containing protein [Thioalkalivibrio sp. XN279]
MSEKEFWTPPAPEPDKAPEPEPFLRRWARLKSDPAARDGEPSPQPPAPPAAEEVADTGAARDEAAEGSEAQLPPADEDLPPLEALDEHSDYSGFMSPRVSGALRKQALRKLFRSQKFNYICELDDYIDDFTSFPALGDIVTADMKHAAERLLKQQLEAEEADAAAASAAADPEARPGAEDAADSAGNEAVASAGADADEQPDDASGEAPDAATDPSEDKQRDA